MVAFLGANPTIESKKGTASTFTHTLLAGSDRVVVVVVAGYGPANPNACTYGGVTMGIVPDTFATSGSTGAKCQAYWLAEADLPADGANTVAPTWAADVGIQNITLYTFLLEGLQDAFVQGDAVAAIGAGAYPATVTIVGSEANSALVSVATEAVLSLTLAADVGTQSDIVEIDDSYDKQCRSTQSGEGGDRTVVWTGPSGSTTKSAVLAVTVESLTSGAVFTGSRMGIV